MHKLSFVTAERDFEAKHSRSRAGKSCNSFGEPFISGFSGVAEPAVAYIIRVDTLVAEAAYLQVLLLTKSDLA